MGNYQRNPNCNMAQSYRPSLFRDQYPFLSTGAPLTWTRNRSMAASRQRPRRNEAKKRQSVRRIERGKTVPYLTRIPQHERDQFHDGSSKAGYFTPKRVRKATRLILSTILDFNVVPA